MEAEYQPLKTWSKTVATTCLPLPDPFKQGLIFFNQVLIYLAIVNKIYYQVHHMYMQVQMLFE